MMAGAIADLTEDCAVGAEDQARAISKALPHNPVAAASCRYVHVGVECRTIADLAKLLIFQRIWYFW
jgi:hypothetical protein